MKKRLLCILLLCALSAGCFLVACGEDPAPGSTTPRTTVTPGTTTEQKDDPVTPGTTTEKKEDPEVPGSTTTEKKTDPDDPDKNWTSGWV